MTAEELAAYLKRSRRTVYRWVRLQKIPVIRASGSLLFDLDAVNRWLDDVSKGTHRVHRGHPGVRVSTRG